MCDKEGLRRRERGIGKSEKKHMYTSSAGQRSMFTVKYYDVENYAGE